MFSDCTTYNSKVLNTTRTQKKKVFLNVMTLKTVSSHRFEGLYSLHLQAKQLILYALKYQYLADDEV